METNNNEIVTYTNPHPGSVLESELEARGISVTDFSIKSGIELPILKGILNKEIALTPEIAKKFESALGIDATFWLNYQHRYDTWPERRAAYEAAHPEVPRSKELIKIQKSRKKAEVYAQPA